MSESPASSLMSCTAKRVLMIVTGGTICMRPKLETGSLNMADLSCASLSSVLKDLPFLSNPTLPLFDILEWKELLDSSDIANAHWKKLAGEIQENYNDYDGFVILHGTDTLSLTATALSFIFKPLNLQKTIVVTGSMLPLAHVNTDAPRNLSVSLLVAGFSQLNEVVVCFGTRILRGCRVMKTNCNIIDPFDTPNYPHLGRIGIEITINESNNAICNSPRFVKSFEELTPAVGEIVDLMTDRVCILRITPGFNIALLEQLAKTTERPLGIILQLYGTGTAPSCQKFSDTIKFAIESGVTIVAVTQCQSGTCSLKTYSNGVLLHNLGLIEGKDLTSDAAFVKLSYLFGRGLVGEDLRRAMETNMVGELHECTNTITGQGTLFPTDQSRKLRVETDDHFKSTVTKLNRF